MSDSATPRTVAGCHALLQEIFLTPGSNPSLLCVLHRQMSSVTTEPPEKPQVYPMKTYELRVQVSEGNCTSSAEADISQKHLPPKHVPYTLGL